MDFEASVVGQTQQMPCSCKPLQVLTSTYLSMVLLVLLVLLVLQALIMRSNLFIGTVDMRDCTRLMLLDLTVSAGVHQDFTSGL
jgi:hypothetical protein